MCYDNEVQTIEIKGNPYTVQIYIRIYSLGSYANPDIDHLIFKRQSKHRNRDDCLSIPLGFAIILVQQQHTKQKSHSTKANEWKTIYT